MKKILYIALGFLLVNGTCMQAMNQQQLRQRINARVVPTVDENELQYEVFKSRCDRVLMTSCLGCFLGGTCIVGTVIGGGLWMLGLFSNDLDFNVRPVPPV